MKRKVNKVGQNTLTISLPNKWVKQNSITSGTELELFEDGKNLVILNEKKEKKIKKVVLNLDDFNKMMINRYIHEFYRQGVEEIVLTFSRDFLPDYKGKGEILVETHIKKLVDRFIGMEIVSQTKNKIILESLMSHEESGKIELIQKRVFFLIKEFLDEFISAMDGDFFEFNKKVYDYHDNIAKFTYYYLRLLHFSEISEEKKSRLFGLYMMIDRSIDKVRHSGEKISEIKKITPKLKKYVSEIFNCFLAQFDVLSINFSVKELELLIDRRYKIVNNIKKESFSDNELKSVSELSILLDSIPDFCETYAALHSDNLISDV